MSDNKNTGGDYIGEEAPGDEIVQIDWHRYEQPVLGIIEAIAGIKDRRPTDLPPLGHEIDVDALNSLLAPDTESSKVAISFEYQGLRVTIRQSGNLVVESPTQG